MMITIGCLSKTNNTSAPGNCTNCDNYQPKLFRYDLINLCEFCSVVAVFSTSPHIMKKGVLLYSELKQKEIINLTHNFFLKNKRIPMIHEIDEEAKRPRQSVPHIMKNIKSFQNIKLFFTDMINFSALSCSIFSEKPTTNDDLLFFDDVEKNID